MDILWCNSSRVWDWNEFGQSFLLHNTIKITIAFDRNPLISSVLSWTIHAGWHFKWLFLKEILLSKFRLTLFLRVHLMISQHLFRQWHGAKQVTSHYLKQWCPSSGTPMFIRRQCVNSFIPWQICKNLKKCNRNDNFCWHILRIFL